MRKNNFFFWFVCLGTITSCAPKLDCEDFHDGQFYFSPGDEIDEEFNIYRIGNHQIEVSSKGYEKTYKLKWHNDCSYTATMSESKEKMTRSIDSIRINFSKIIKDTAYFESKIYTDNKIFEISGSRMIRIGDVPPF